MSNLEYGKIEFKEDAKLVHIVDPESFKPSLQIPWFDNVKEAEDFCMTPVGNDNRLIDKAKKDFIRRSAKIRKTELLCWSGKGGIR